MTKKAQLVNFPGGVNRLNFDQCKQTIKAWQNFTLNLVTKITLKISKCV